ncbi:gene transfer agent family protein [Nereida sp. NH-UV-3]|uniref:gene transfer agent family protein n=1 Tax=Nereida TaxID=282198 RepID=UPI0036F24250
MMVNPHRGEVEITINGKPYVARLSLGALASLETKLGASSLTKLIERFEGNSIRSSDVLALIEAGLSSGNWDGTAADLLHADVNGGPLGAARAAAQLLVRAFGDDV